MFKRGQWKIHSLKSRPVAIARRAWEVLAAPGAPVWREGRPLGEVLFFFLLVNRWVTTISWNVGSLEHHVQRSKKSEHCVCVQLMPWQRLTE